MGPRVKADGVQIPNVEGDPAGFPAIAGVVE
jgi:hypothetical protein